MTFQNPGSSPTSVSHSMYYVFRRRIHHSAKCLTIYIILLFITLNVLVYTNFSSLFSPEVLNPELPVERRETSPMIRDSAPRRPFTTHPTWMDDWLREQKISPELNQTEGEGLIIDIVYTWVNGSDEKLQAIKTRHQDASPLFQSTRAGAGIGGGSLRRGGMVSMGDQTANRFRDMDELRYSVRSVSQYASRMFKKIYILTTEVDPETDEGQVPSWLDLSASKGVIELVQHDKVFDDPSVLPSFNSLSIESQIHHIPGLRDVFLYLNDDVFLGTTMLPADVWTPLYGFVFHMEPTLLVPPTILLAAPNAVAIGEWNSLQYSNFLLSKQFGARHRSYLAHVPHVLSAPVLQEIQNMWPAEFAETSSHRFRGEGQAKDVQVSFFMAHYVLERLRETQLTSYWLHRLDANQDGELNWTEREALIKRVEHWNMAQNNLPYFRNFSSFVTGSKDHLDQLGFPPSGSSIYRMSGQDGYPFMLKFANTTSSAWNADKTPYLIYDEVSQRRCHFDVDFCLGSDFKDSNIASIDATTSANIFQRMAFTEFHCGDCLLHILRQSAAEPGLGSEIMPLDRDSDAYKAVSMDLAKYNYVISTSAYSFVQLQEPFGSQRNLAQILAKKDTEAFFCINDNVGDNARVVGMIQQVFRQFLDERFSIASPWEKKDL